MVPIHPGSDEVEPRSPADLVQKTEHICPNCKHTLTVYHSIQDSTVADERNDGSSAEGSPAWFCLDEGIGNLDFSEYYAAFADMNPYDSQGDTLPNQDRQSTLPNQDHGGRLQRGSEASSSSTTITSIPRSPLLPPTPHRPLETPVPSPLAQPPMATNQVNNDPTTKSSVYSPPLLVPIAYHLGEMGIPGPQPQTSNSSLHSMPLLILPPAAYSPFEMAVSSPIQQSMLFDQQPIQNPKTSNPVPSPALLPRTTYQASIAESTTIHDAKSSSSVYSSPLLPPVPYQRVQMAVPSPLPQPSVAGVAEDVNKNASKIDKGKKPQTSLPERTSSLAYRQKHDRSRRVELSTAPKNHALQPSEHSSPTPSVPTLSTDERMLIENWLAKIPAYKAIEPPEPSPTRTTDLYEVFSGERKKQTVPISDRSLELRKGPQPENKRRSNSDVSDFTLEPWRAREDAIKANNRRKWVEFDARPRGIHELVLFETDSEIYAPWGNC